MTSILVITALLLVGMFVALFRSGCWSFPLTSRMYESRDFSAMPILADALQAAGCDNPDILARPHQRFVT